MQEHDPDKLLSGVRVPKPERIAHQEELRIPLLSYKRSSRVGLWLLALPVIVAMTDIVKNDLAIESPFASGIRRLFATVDGTPVLTLLIPLLFVVLPCAAMIMNAYACMHFQYFKERKEIVVTIKYRLVNIAVFLFSFVVLAFFLLPDRLSF